MNCCTEMTTRDRYGVLILGMLAVACAFGALVTQVKMAEVRRELSETQVLVGRVKAQLVELKEARLKMAESLDQVRGDLRVMQDACGARVPDFNK